MTGLLMSLNGKASESCTIRRILYRGKVILQRSLFRFEVHRSIRLATGAQALYYIIARPG
jgi:hypothetical protein